MEEELTDIPTLIYDGPYSDHIYEKEPEMLKNTKTVAESEAEKTASKYMGCDTNDLKSDGLVEGNIPSFRFLSEEGFAEVSKNGGYVVFMRKNRQIKNSELSYDQAIEKAKRYLEMLNILSMEYTYYYTNEGVCVINFAFVDGKTICYTDLIWTMVR